MTQTPQEASLDVVVLGAGPVGENAAQYAGQGSGLEVALVERELVGGECSYWACMPSKTLLRPVELLREARQVPVWDGPLPGIDTAALLARRDRVVNDHDDASQVRWAQGAGIDVVRGHGRLAGERRVEVTAADGSRRVLSAQHAVVLATGSRPSVPAVPGLLAARPWTSRDVTNLHEVPAAVVVVGGGVVACESATWLAALGARVTVVQRGPRLLAGQEPFAGELVADALRESGVDVRLGVAPVRVERPDVGDAGEGHRHGGPVRVELSDGTSVVADEVVVAAGRTPNSDDVGLDTVGLTPGGPVAVRDDFTVDGLDGRWLYAVGDVNGRALLTHLGKHQARLAGGLVAARATGGDTASPWVRDLAGLSAVPQVTFTAPPVASVGQTLEAALSAGLPAQAVDVDLAALAGTYVQADGYVGRARMVVDTGRGTLLGLTLVGDGTGELVHSATVAIVGGVALERLWHAVPSYPTVSEAWLRLLEAWRAEAG